MSRHIVIASGGTGGHFYPTLSIARELTARGHAVSLIVAGRHAEEHLRLAAANGLRAQAVSAFRLPRDPLSAIRFPFRFLRAIRAARLRLLDLAPDVVLGMGSFASVPACLAASRQGIPLILHEGNAWMGRANRFLSCRARTAGISLPLDPRCRVHCPTVHVGMPLRQALVDAATAGREHGHAAESFGLNTDMPTILVFGGSQGARFLNGMMASVAPLLRDLADRLQVVHLTGTGENADLVRTYAGAGVRACVRRSDPNIQNAYSFAGLVLCRAGASSICELALFGKPAILIPLPSAAEDHQSANAKLLAGRRAALHVAQAEATAERISGHIADWLHGDESYAAMGRAIHDLSVVDAAGRMATLCLETAGDPVIDGQH